MPYRHVFATHAKLQEYLAEAFIRERGIPPEEVLLLRNRGTFAMSAPGIYDSIDGDRFQVTNGRNVIAHRRRNRAVEEDFQRRVLDRCAPDVQVYSAMYSYWYLRWLRQVAAGHHILEDGLGSFQSLEEFDQWFGKSELAAAAPVGWRRLLGQTDRQRATDIGGREVFATAGSFLTTSPLCFPWVEPARRIVLRDVFPPQYAGEYAGAKILGTSCLVEDNMIGLPDYLEMLGGVLAKIGRRGWPHLHFKLHPRQARGPHAAHYRETIRRGLPGTQVTELEQTVSIERLAAGNPITLITGLSTLAFHVHGPNGHILSYLDDLAAAQPRVLTERAARGLELFRGISEVL